MVDMNVTTVPNQKPVYIKTEKGWTTKEPILTSVEHHKKSAPEIAGEIISVGAAAAAIAYTSVAIIKKMRPVNVRQTEKVKKLFEEFRKDLINMEQNILKVNNYAAQNYCDLIANLEQNHKSLESVKEMLKEKGLSMSDKKLLKLKQDLEKATKEKNTDFATKDMQEFYDVVISALQQQLKQCSALKWRYYNQIDELFMLDKVSKFRLHSETMQEFERIYKEHKSKILKAAKKERKRLASFKAEDLRSIAAKEKANERLSHRNLAHLTILLEKRGLDCTVFS